MRVGVIGLGYVGLPLAAAFAQQGVDVVGVEIDQRKIDAVAAGDSYIDGLDDADFDYVAGFHDFVRILDELVGE